MAPLGLEVRDVRLAQYFAVSTRKARGESGSRTLASCRLWSGDGWIFPFLQGLGSRVKGLWSASLDGSSSVTTPATFPL